ncbi:MAG: YfhO family protein [Ruminococcus sp.]|nr:YfhO family protein [Ruminococcus sp.]
MTKKANSRFLSILISPIVTVIAVLFVFWRTGLYPFGDKTASWCDMNQQVVPLLCQLKDILDGESGMFLSFKNAGGMSFWGVFFFFLSSPFSFLVKFVEKSDMLLFVNILILIKMAVCASSASLYFSLNREFNLNAAEISLLGFLYALSGYVMLFYQNIIWLDVMYLFPLLLISLHRLHEKGSPVMYTILMTTVIIVNYYIGFMIVIFVLLLAALYSFSVFKSDGKSSVCLKFLAGSLLAAMLSAVVWLPSFLQYLTSGRTTSILESIRTADFITDYQTVLPVIMCSSVLLILSCHSIFSQSIKKTSQRKLWTLMLVLLLIPLVIEPINKMWHTGSYMSFPARYAFMTIFMLLIMAAYALDKKTEYKENLKQYALGALVCAVAAIIFEQSSAYFIEENIDTLSTYTSSLSGSEDSFKALLRLTIIGIVCVGVIYFIYRKGMVFKGFFLVFICAIAVIEGMEYTEIYMTTSGQKNADTNALQRQIMLLEDKIEDDSFYRVKTSSKIVDYNAIGAIGYNSIGHYTSLTDEDYMFMMKHLGYTSVWMEVGTCGGTELTDSLLCIGYELSREENDDSVYSLSDFYITPLENKLSLGILTSSVLDEEIPSELTCAQVQQYIFEKVFDTDETLISEYSPDEGEYSFDNESGKYEIKNEERLIYRIDVDGELSLYFDCFDELTNELSEPIYNSFKISVNGKTISSSYPSSTENGVLSLGTFENERVIIEVLTLKDTECASFGVFGLDTNLLDRCCESTQTIGLSEVKNGLVGSITTNSAQEILLSVPYDSGFTVKVNGESIDYQKTLSGLISFTLPQGECEIEISFVPNGLVIGAVIFVSGAILFAVVLILKRKKPSLFENVNHTLEKASEITVIAIGALVFAIVYILPFIANALFWKNE